MTHQDLKEAAEKATPGPWVFIPAGNRPQIFAAKNMDIMIARVESLQFVEDAAFIALANPSSILSLIEENERMREALAADNATLRLYMGELSAQEIRAVRAAFNWVLARAALKEKPHD